MCQAVKWRAAHLDSAVNVCTAGRLGDRGLARRPQCGLLAETFVDGCARVGDVRERRLRALGRSIKGAQLRQGFIGRARKFLQRLWQSAMRERARALPRCRADSAALLG